MTTYPNFRSVVSVCPCAGAGEAIYCDDGAVFYSLPDGDKPRTYVEGVPVPGSRRAVDLDIADSNPFMLLEVAKQQRNAWEAVARNLANLLPVFGLLLTDLREAAGLHTNAVDLAIESAKTSFVRQCEAHGVTP